MERIRRARAMCRGVGQWIDELELLDNRAGPSVADEERQRILMFRTNMNEMDVEPIDLGDEVWQVLQFLLALAPVVLCRPIARECLHRRELHPLRQVIDGFLVGPACGSDPSTQVLQVRLGSLDLERSQHDVCRDRSLVIRCSHVVLLDCGRMSGYATKPDRLICTWR